MLKPNKTFKLSKSTKRMMCSILNTEQRNAFKRAMIDAELCAAIVPKTRDRSNDNKRPQGTSYTTTSNSATPSAE